jgi:hypothetical protein
MALITVYSTKNKVTEPHVQTFEFSKFARKIENPHKLAKYKLESSYWTICVFENSPEDHTPKNKICWATGKFG